MKRKTEFNKFAKESANLRMQNKTKLQHSVFISTKKKTQTGASKLNIFRPHFRSPPTKKSMPHHLPHPKRCIQN